MSLRVFWSYAHDDRLHYEEIRRAFATMERNGDIAAWYDGEIVPGTPWRAEIVDAMATADIVLLVVSRYFLSSEFCMGVELRQALSRRPAIPVIPVILSTCDWKGEETLAELQALPDEGNPLRGVQGLDEERLQAVVEGVRRVVKREKMRARAEAIAPAPRPRIVVPATLPYLCDRDRQDGVLEQHVGRHLAATPQRPFVCFIHGRAPEHTGYLERLAAHSLPRYLRFTDDVEVEPRLSLDWPGSDVPPAEAVEQFRSNLGSTLNCAAGELADEVKRYGRPLLIYSELFSDEWPDQGEAYLRAYLDFWNTFPVLEAPASLIACTLLRYQGESSADRRTMAEIQSVLQTVEAELRAGRYPGLSGIVLPELGPVPRKDVRGLAGKPKVQRFCRLDRYREEWITAVDEIYGEHEELSMKDVDQHLRRLFQQFAERG